MSGSDDDRPLWEQMASRNADLPRGERLQKVLAAVGFGSRRTAEDLIAAGRVTVNGDVAILGRRVDADHDLIEVDGAPIGVKPDLVYYMLNKPTGVVSTSDDTHGRPTVIEIVPSEPRVFSVGRLDAETEGLLLITNDGHLANRIAHPRHGVDKEYLVEVDGGAVTPGELRRLRDGVELDDGVTAPAKVSQPEPGILRMTIHEGRNRQVRRMCDAVGHPVRRLVRTRIGPLSDRTLQPGEWREWTIDERNSMIEAVASSTPRDARIDADETGANGWIADGPNADGPHGDDSDGDGGE